MNSRERFKKALAHQEPNRIPFDIGGSVVTGIASSAYQKLIPAMGLPERPIRIASVYSQTAILDEDVLKALQVDTRPLPIQNPTSWKLEIQEDTLYRRYIDEWQIEYSMPLESRLGYTAVRAPLSQATTVQEIENYPWPDGNDISRFAGMAEQAHLLANVEQVGVILETSIGGVFEWPAWLRGTEAFLCDLANGSVMAEAIIAKVVEFKVTLWESALACVGDLVDLVRESDDRGGQTGLLISPRMYRKYILPAHRKICETIHKHTQAAVCLHSCGSVWDLIPDFIDAGFNVLNPVQVGAAKMSPTALKKEFGQDLVFWGASVDSQTILPFASPEKVKQEARQNIEALAPGGGYIYAPINMINADVPPENVLALAEVVSEYGR